MLSGGSALCSSCASRKAALQQNHGPLPTFKVGYPDVVVLLIFLAHFLKAVLGVLHPNGRESLHQVDGGICHNQIFCRFSPPKRLQGRKFQYSATGYFATSCECTIPEPLPTILNVIKWWSNATKHYYTTTYYCKDHPFDWEDQLPKICMVCHVWQRGLNLLIDLMYISHSQQQLSMLQQHGNPCKKHTNRFGRSQGVLMHVMIIRSMESPSKLVTSSGCTLLSHMGSLKTIPPMEPYHVCTKIETDSE